MNTFPPIQKMYYINQTKKKSGITYPFINEIPIGGGKKKVEITFEIDGQDANDTYQLYFIEQEWLDDIKKL